MGRGFLVAPLLASLLAASPGSFPAAGALLATGALADPTPDAESPEPIAPAAPTAPTAGSDAGETPVDLGALLSEAEASSPEILASRARLLAAGHIPSQMESPPDPLASVAYTNETFTDLTLGSSPDANLAFYWSQEVPYPGKLRLAGDVARAEIDATALRLDGLRLRVRAEVKSAYAELFRLDRTSEILGESRKLLESFRSTTRARSHAGQRKRPPTRSRRAS